MDRRAPARRVYAWRSRCWLCFSTITFSFWWSSSTPPCRLVRCSMGAALRRRARPRAAVVLLSAAVLSRLVQPAPGVNQPPPAPAGFSDLLVGDSDPRGRVLRPPNTSLAMPGAIWDHGAMNLTFEQTYADHGSYALRSKWGRYCNATGHGSDASLCHCDMWTKGGDGEHAIPLLPNRRYIVAATIKTSFDRLGVEINIGVPLVKRLLGSSVGQHANGSRFGGLPANSSAVRPISTFSLATRFRIQI